MTCNDTGYQAIEFDKDTHLPMVSLEKQIKSCSTEKLEVRGKTHKILIEITLSKTEQPKTTERKPRATLSRSNTSYGLTSSFSVERDFSIFHIMECAVRAILQRKVSKKHTL